MRIFLSIIIILSLSLGIHSQDEDSDFLDRVSGEKAKTESDTKSVKSSRKDKKKGRKKNKLRKKGKKSKKQKEEINAKSQSVSDNLREKFLSGSWTDPDLNPVYQNPNHKNLKDQKPVQLDPKKIESPIEPKEVKQQENKESLLWEMFSGLSNYKKFFIIAGLVIVFALYRLKTQNSKYSGGRGSPKTINRYVKK